MKRRLWLLCLTALTLVACGPSYSVYQEDANSMIRINLEYADLMYERTTNGEDFAAASGAWNNDFLEFKKRYKDHYSEYESYQRLAQTGKIGTLYNLAFNEILTGADAKTRSKAKKEYKRVHEELKKEMEEVEKLLSAGK